MKKTVVFAFPDDFIFPKYPDDKLCNGCQLLCGDTYELDQRCFVTGCYTDEKAKEPCTFYDGADTVNY